MNERKVKIIFSGQENLYIITFYGNFKIMTKLPITYRGTVYPWHCDHMGHMNVMWYTGKFDEASWQMLTQIGLTRAVLGDRNRMMAALQQNITYKRELHAGDVVTIRSGILEVKEKIIRFFHEMKNEATGEIAAITEITGVYMDALTRRSIVFPEYIRERAGELIADYEEEIWVRNSSSGTIHHTFPPAKESPVTGL